MVFFEKLVLFFFILFVLSIGWFFCGGLISKVVEVFNDIVVVVMFQFKVELVEEDIIVVEELIDIFVVIVGIEFVFDMLDVIDIFNNVNKFDGQMVVCIVNEERLGIIFDLIF